MAWKTLDHPNVLPLLGVIMTKNRFAMVSDWMANGNINQFLEKHQDANRFELVRPGSSLPPSSAVDVFPIVGRRREGIDVYARSGNNPWGSQGGVYWKVTATCFH